MSNKLGKRKRRLLETVTTEKPLILVFEKGWYRQYPKIDRENFELMAIIHIGFVLTIGWAIVDYDFPEVHKAVSFYCVGILLLFMIKKSEVSTLFANTKSVFTEFKASTISEMTDSLFIINLGYTLIAILFVIDFETLADSSWRIGAAAAVGFATAIKHVIQSFRGSRSDDK